MKTSQFKDKTHSQQSEKSLSNLRLLFVYVLFFHLALAVVSGHQHNAKLQTK